MPKKYRSPENSLQPPEGTAGEWVSATLNDQNLDILAAETFDPSVLYANALRDGRPVQAQASAEYAADPGVAGKNRLLGVLAELIDDDRLQVGDFLTLLDTQAACSARPEELRLRQFAGLLDILTRVAADEQLSDWLKRRSAEP